MTTPKLMRETPAWVFIPVLLVTFFTLSYCTEKQTRNSDNAVEDFKVYVNEKVNSADSTIEENWEEVEKDYNEKKQKADAKTDKLENEAKESYNKAVADWEAYKQRVAERRAIKQSEKDAKLLRASLVPVDINSDLSNVNGKNVASVYDHFVSEVEKNKETYSKEQWVSVNNYWQSLNDVYDKLDSGKAVSKEDSKKVSKSKSRYAGTKMLNKPFAESENK